MTEVLTARLPELEAAAEPEELETRAKTKTKIITAAVLGAVGIGAGYVEARGYVRGWPPPFHSFKHPWIGYYSALAASRFSRSKSTAAAAGVIGDAAAESVQDIVNTPDHFPFHWLDFNNSHRLEGNEDNLVDLALCMGGTALFLAQNNQAAGWAKNRFSQLFTRPDRSVN